MKLSQLQLLQHSCGLLDIRETDPPTAENDDLASAARLITQGAFLDVVRTVPAIRALLDCSSELNTVNDAESYYAVVGRRAVEAVEAATSAERAASGRDGVHQLEAIMLAGVASLHIFGQHNLTGPTYEGPPPSPLDLFAPTVVAKHMAAAPPRPPVAVAAAAIASVAGGGGGSGSADRADGKNTAATESCSETATAETPFCSGSETSQPDGLSGLGMDSLSRGDRWAQEQLQVDGEDLVGRCPAVQWLLLARVLLLGSLGDQQRRQEQQLQQLLKEEGSQQQQQRHQDKDHLGLERQPQPSAAVGGRAKEEGGVGAAASAAASAAAGAPLGRLAALLRTPHPTQCQHPGQGPAHPGAPWAWAWPWWALRCVMSQQHCLDGHSHSLLSEASQLVAVLVSSECPWSQPSAAGSGSGSGSADSASCRPTGRELAALGGVLHVELALCQYLYGYVDAGRQYLMRAGQLLGLEPQLTGAMGRRTVHQVDPKAQLVVVASKALRVAAPSDATEEPLEWLGLAGVVSGGGGGGGVPGPANRELEGLRDDSDVLLAPVLLGEDGTLLDTRYSAPEQALLLAWAAAVKKGNSADDLQEWQMAPWVEAVLSQHRGVFMTIAAARLIKTRHERTRGRTRERALLQMNQLAEAVTGTPPPPSPLAAAETASSSADAAKAETPEASTSSAAIAAVTAAAAAVSADATTATAAVGEGSKALGLVSGRRAVLSWAVWFPLQVKLKRETAEHYVSMGLVGAAIRMFESLELWDSALTCYRLVGKKALAEELIRRRLVVTPDDPRLWCALGDLHLDDRYYEAAWHRSGRRHTRSQRSLARSAMRRKDYCKAAGHWEAALSLNPLHAEAWFSLGFCCLKQDRHRQALRAFTRVTQQEPDNGEAWNNIAALWMHLGGYRPAFNALTESVKHKRDSWQTWENYARAALASGHYQQAVRGLQMSFRLSSGQRLFLDAISGLLDVLEGRPPPRDGGTSMAAAAAAAAEGLRGVAVAEGLAVAEADDASLKDDEAALGVPLLPLLSDMPLRNLPPGLEEEIDGEDVAEAATTTVAEQVAAAAAAALSTTPSEALLSGREREVVMGGLGSLLREAVNSSAATAALWGCLARYWALRGEAESAKEARIKQIRGLTGAGFKSDAGRFSEYAEASEALGRCYLDTHKQGKPGGLKDLAAGRMHLRGLLRATAENFGNHLMTAKLQALLDEITRLEDEALAASRAATAAKS